MDKLRVNLQWPHGDGASNIRVAAMALSIALVDAARRGLHRAWPHRSAKRVLYATQIFGVLLLIAVIGLSFSTLPAARWSVLHAIGLGLFAIAILWRLAAASSLKPLPGRLYAAPGLVYSVLCPLLKEANVVAPRACATR